MPMSFCSFKEYFVEKPILEQTELDDVTVKKQTNKQAGGVVVVVVVVVLFWLGPTMSNVGL